MPILITTEIKTKKFEKYLYISSLTNNKNITFFIGRSPVFSKTKKLIRRKALFNISENFFKV